MNIFPIACIILMVGFFVKLLEVLSLSKVA